MKANSRLGECVPIPALARFKGFDPMCLQDSDLALYAFIESADSVALGCPFHSAAKIIGWTAYFAP